jgi:tetratricopeptide (TPR) repeat protein
MRILAAAFACAILPCLLSCAMSDKTFKTRIRKFDIQLAMGDTRSAAALLSSTKAGASLQRRCSLLKREYRLSLVSGDASRYVKAALKAAHSSPSLTLKALAAQALLSQGRGGEARAVLGEDLSGASSGSLKKLKLALALDDAANLEGRSGLSRPADHWEALAQGTGRGGFYLNAALSALVSGDGNRAALETQAALDSGFSVPPQVAYDAGLYGLCLGLIDEQLASRERGKDGGAALVRLAADASFRNGDTVRAQAAWEDALREFPASSSASLHNLAALEKDPEKRRSLLERGVELYPGDRGRLLDLAAFHASRGEREAGLALLGAEEAALQDPEAFPIRLSLGAIGAESAQTEAAILKTLQAHREDEALARFSFFKLLGLKRHEAAFRILLDEEKARPNAAWLPFARACLLAARGKSDDAIAAFDDCDWAAVHYASRWNAALLLSRARDWNGARRRLSDAIESAAGKREKALAYAFLGDCYRYQNLGDSAKTAYLAALTQWPDCPEAGMALAGLMNDGKERSDSESDPSQE